MNEVSPKIIKKIQTLAQIAADLRDGKDYNITRLTLLKSLCSDPEAAAKFALHLAKRTLEKMKSQDCPSHIKPEDWEHYQRLAAKAVRGMTKHLKQRTPAGESPLHELLQIIRDAQGEFERQQWGAGSQNSQPGIAHGGDGFGMRPPAKRIPTFRLRSGTSILRTLQRSVRDWADSRIRTVGRRHR